MRTADRHEAQDKIIGAVVGLALRAEEEGDENVANAIRELGASLARKYGLANVPGLPKTFADLQRSATSACSAGWAPS